MEWAVQVIWWVGLGGALSLTLVILKEVFLVLRTLRDIHRLAEHTRTAALRIAAHTATADEFDLLREPTERLSRAAGAIASVSASVQRKLGALK